MVTMADIGYAAGFYEGEGSFGSSNANSPMVSITQKDIEPLEKMQKLFGGTIAKYGKYHYWRLSRAEGRGFIMTIFTFLSARRRNQILKYKDSFFSIDKCPNGHEYEEGTFEMVEYSGRSARKQCLICLAINQIRNGKNPNAAISKLEKRNLNN